MLGNDVLEYTPCATKCRLVFYPLQVFVPSGYKKNYIRGVSLENMLGNDVLDYIRALPSAVLFSIPYRFSYHRVIKNYIRGFSLENIMGNDGLQHIYYGGVNFCFSFKVYFI